MGEGKFGANNFEQTIATLAGAHAICCEKL